MTLFLVFSSAGEAGAAAGAEQAGGRARTAHAAGRPEEVRSAVG